MAFSDLSVLSFRQFGVLALLGILSSACGSDAVQPLEDRADEFFSSTNTGNALRVDLILNGDLIIEDEVANIGKNTNFACSASGSDADKADLFLVILGADTEVEIPVDDNESVTGSNLKSGGPEASDPSTHVSHSVNGGINNDLVDGSFSGDDDRRFEVIRPSEEESSRAPIQSGSQPDSVEPTLSAFEGAKVYCLAVYKGYEAKSAGVTLTSFYQVELPGSYVFPVEPE